jgi:uncharacterized SAM-binding protein YcdF (DUF218 family)
VQFSVPRAEPATFDALVLLGCPVAAKLPGPAARRAARAADAYLAGLAPRVVVSGGRRWGGLVEADRLADELVRRGVPRSAILLERSSQTTRDNARYTARLLAELGVRKLGLVSCDWHLRRALWCFEHFGFEAHGVAAPSPPARPTRRVWRVLREFVAGLVDRGACAVW